MNLSQLLFMHGYGMYVWPTYFITLAVFGVNLFSTLNEKKHTKNMIKQFLINTHTNE